MLREAGAAPVRGSRNRRPGGGKGMVWGRRILEARVLRVGLALRKEVGRKCGV